MVPRRHWFISSVLLAALGPALVLFVAIAWLNPRLAWADLPPIAVDLWVVSLGLVGIPLAALVLLLRFARVRLTAADYYRLAAVWLFAWLWIARFEPAHQPISIRPHLSRWGAIEIGVIFAWSTAIFALWRGRLAARVSRWLAVPSAFVLASLCLLALAAVVEPSRRRDVPLAEVARRFPPQTQATAPSSRVLVIGIDGLEWRTINWMTAHGRMPAVASLLRTGRFYQHDNEALTYSAEIWTSMWTGRPSRENDVGDFAKWRFTGARRSVVFVPRFGMHGLWFLDEVLRRTDKSPLWVDETTSTADILTPPIWSIASAAGRRIAVFDPVPQAVAPEEVNGFFGVTEDDGLEFTWTRGGSPYREEIKPDPSHLGGEFGAEDETARIVADLLRRERFDLALFYTHFVDSTEHSAWDFKLRGGFLGGDPAEGLDERFDNTPIRRAYDDADRQIAQLVAAFGQPATVVLVSDHGWRYDDYEHFRSPFGVLAVAPAPATGYGGVADLRSITPTILSLLNIPLDPTMAEPIPGIASHRTSTTYAGTVVRRFVDRDIDDSARRERLRSLGYVEGRVRVRRPSPSR